MAQRTERPEQPGHGRGNFPTLLGAELQGIVTFWTSSGKPLVATLDGVTIEAARADAPARVTGPGRIRERR